MLQGSRWLRSNGPPLGGATSVPRFFTGALFPEATTHLLRQHQPPSTASSSCGVAARIWVPRKLVASGTFGPAVLLGVDPVLVNPTVSVAAEAMEFSKHLGPESLLVNAQHTTNPEYFAQYLAYLEGAANTIGQPSSFPYIPQSVTGGLFQTRIAAKLTEAATRAGFASPYWIPEDWCRRRQPVLHVRAASEAAVRIGGGAWLNVEQTMSPGMFDALFAALQCYEPHTVYGGQFPRVVEAQMRTHAVSRGWTMRLWLTQKEARSFGCSLLEGEASTIMTAALTRSDLDTYFNAAQFDHSERLPTRRQLLVLGSNVDGMHGVYAKGFATLAPTAPNTSPEARRTFLAQHQHYTPFVKSEYETQRLGIVAQQPLRQHAMLCGFSDPYFMSCHELNRSPQLVLRKGARGRCIHGGIAAAKHCVYFNSEDFECPNVVRALLSKPSLHLLTYRRFFGALQVQMAEYLARTNRTAASRFWVPTDFLAQHRFDVPHLPSTFHLTHDAGHSYLRGYKHNMSTNIRPWSLKQSAPPAGGDVGGAADADGVRHFVHVGDVPDPDGRLAQVCAYVPVRVDGRPFLDVSRQRMLAAALEHNLLQSDPRWLSVDYCRQACGPSFSLSDMHCPSVDEADGGGEGGDDAPVDSSDATAYEDPLGPATSPGLGLGDDIVSTQNGRAVMVPFCGLTLRQQTAITHYLAMTPRAVQQTLWNKMHVGRFERTPRTSNYASRRDSVVSEALHEVSALPCDANVY